jgi:general secretion pathway protein F/type IV pilus assembly protein PilC
VKSEIRHPKSEMAEFHYTARQLSGANVEGTIVAASQQEAITVLVGQALFPLRVGPVERRGMGRRRIPTRHLVVVYSHLADLLHAGVPLLGALDILRQENAHPALADVLGKVRARVADGVSLSDAMQAHPALFSELVVSMVRAGEEGGFAEDALKRIAGFTEQQAELRSRVLGALAYPAFLMVTGILVVSGMLVFFVPNFAPIFDRLREQGELPLPTILLMGLSSFLRRYGVWLLLALVGGGWALGRFFASEAGRRLIHRWMLEVKLVGPIVQGIAVARVCRVLGTLLRNGVPMLNSLRIAKDAAGNRLLSDAIAAAADNVSAGKSLAQPLGACGRFPREVIEMVAVGEKANKLEQVLLDAADTLERRTGRQLDLFVRLLEPVMLLVMAGIILFLVIALLLPVFQATSSLA